MNAPRTKVHPQIASQIANAKLLTIQIEAAAKRLARLMDELHGEEFKFYISHETETEVIVIGAHMKKGGSSRG